MKISARQFSDLSVRRSVVLIALILLPAAIAFPQQSIDDDIPPPMRVISKDERDKLSTVSGEKARVKLALELMDTRIKLAEDALAKTDFNRVHRELGGFHFLMDDALRHLVRNDTGNSASGNNFKRFEITLRTFSPRIELLRREVPINYEPYILIVLKRLREVRTRAVEPLFGN